MHKAGVLKTICVVAGILCFVFGYAIWTISLSKTPIFSSSSIRFDIVLDDASGLQPGSPIRIAGLNVGTVERLDLTRQPAGAILVIAHSSVDLRQVEFMDGGVIASLGSVGVLGDRFIDLGIATASIKGVTLSEGATIVAQPSMSIDKITRVAGNTARNLEVLSEKLNALVTAASLISDGLTTKGSVLSILSSQEAGNKLNETIGHLAEVTDKAEKIMGRLESGNGTLGALLNDDSLYNGLTAFLGTDRKQFLTKSIEDVALAPAISVLSH